MPQRKRGKRNNKKQKRQQGRGTNGT
jgi:hypothetical protein